MAVRLIKFTISFFVWVFDYLYEALCHILRKKKQTRCVILYYHAITGKQRKRFANQMDELLRWTKPIAVDKPNLPPDSNHCAGITFDDGFVSIHKNALPELRKRNIPATLFIPANCLGQRPPWIYDTENSDSGEFIMTADQLKTFKEDHLFSIGSHCLTHRNIKLLDDSEAKKEIFESKKILEDILKMEVKTLSFPHGAFNDRDVELAKQAGYERVFSIMPTLAYRDTDEYVTGRVDARPDDWPLEFRFKLCGAYRWLPLAYSLKRKMSFMMNS
jgi:peptidoglycan/xylan/chitin deacetylase (PgdA/CDA1 family)